MMRGGRRPASPRRPDPIGGWPWRAAVRPAGGLPSGRGCGGHLACGFGGVWSRGAYGVRAVVVPSSARWRSWPGLSGEGVALPGGCRARGSAGRAVWPCAGTGAKRRTPRADGRSADRSGGGARSAPPLMGYSKDDPRRSGTRVRERVARG